jgi:hypothetical protein
MPDRGFAVAAEDDGKNARDAPARRRFTPAA